MSPLHYMSSEIFATLPESLIVISFPEVRALPEGTHVRRFPEVGCIASVIQRLALTEVFPQRL